MKNKLRIVLVVIAVMMAVALSVYAAYDSSTDPLISKSYLEQVFGAQIDAKIQELNTSVNEQKQQLEKQNETILSQQNLIERQKSLLEEQAKTLADQGQILAAQQSLLNDSVKKDSELETSLKTALATIETLQNSVNEQLKTLNALSSEIETQKKTISSLNSQLTSQVQLTESQKTKLSTLEKKLNDISKTIELVGTTGATYQVICVKAGQKLICNGGNDVSTELILRSGEAVAVSQYAASGAYAQGLSDATTSTEIYNGQALTINHLIIIPRGDGRGVKVTSEEAYFLVRGVYEIVNG